MRAILKIMTLSLVLFIASCGDATRNDQGVSFTFFGWFADSEGEEGKTGFVVPISADADSVQADTLAYMGLQNNLIGQFIRVDRVFHEYYIPGAGIQIPKVTDSVATFLSPADGAGSTLPEGFEQGNTAYAQVFLMTPQLMEFIQLNREYLPEPPFTMVIKSYVSGVTSSGKQIESNTLQTDILFTPDIIISGSAA